jgi:hypothetical protein
VAGVLAIPAGALAWWLGSPLFLDKTVDEAFPAAVTSIGAEDSPSTTVAPVDQEQGDMESTGPAPDDVGSANPILVVEGSFVDADSAHRGSGSASIYQLEDGSRVLRFEDFEVTNGPDLHVLLVPTDAQIDRDLLAGTTYFDLGKLKGNVGNQNYDVPSDLDLEGPWTVVIYCDPFHVVFSTAQLSA